MCIMYIIYRKCLNKIRIDYFIKMKLDIDYEWVSLEHENYKNFESVPAVYRWTFKINDKISVYVGETINLKKRINFYKNPGKTQFTNLHIKENYLDKSNDVILEKIKINKFTIDDKNILLDITQEKLLENSYYRKLIENLILVNTKEEIINALNRKKKEE